MEETQKKAQTLAVHVEVFHQKYEAPLWHQFQLQSALKK